MIKYKSPVFSIITLFSFIWLCFVADFSFAQSDEEETLKKAKTLSYQGDYTEAVYLLKDYIIKFDTKKGKRENLAMAYYLLGRTYYMAGDDKKAEENMKVVYKTLPEFKTDEEDFLFQRFAKKVKGKIKPMGTKTESALIKKKEKRMENTAQKGWVGISIIYLRDKDIKEMNIKDPRYSGNGVYILEVDKNSPATRVGLKKFDRILALNGVEVKSTQGLAEKIAVLKPGTKIELTIVRNNKQKRVKLVVTKTPEKVVN